MASHNKGQVITVESKSFDVMAMNTPLTFTPPMIGLAQSPKGFIYHWKIIQRVFDLPNPANFPPLGINSLTTDEHASAHRYIQTAKDLASSSFISSEARVDGSIENGEVQVTASGFPSREVFVGFSTLFRQLYSASDPCSFQNVKSILGRANTTAADSASTQRQQLLKKWGSAEGRMKGYSLTELLAMQLEKEGSWSANMTPRLHDLNPQQLISLYFSGDVMHWGSERDKLALFKAESDISAARELDFMAALIAFSHIYIGFAVLAQAATSGFVINQASSAP